MANICTQVIAIAARDDKAMTDLLALMGETSGHPLDETEREGTPDEVCQRLDGKLSAEGLTRLLLFNPEPDTRGEWSTTSMRQCGTRHVLTVEMALKWGPSLQPDAFCEALDPEAYGWSVANGGEWCEWEDITLDDEIMRPSAYEKKHYAAQRRFREARDDSMGLKELAQWAILYSYSKNSF